MREIVEHLFLGSIGPRPTKELVGANGTMANKLQVLREEHKQKIDKEVLAAIEFELEGSIGHAGGVLRGFSVKYGEADVLITLRVVLAGKKQVAFVGAPDLASCFRKCVTGAYQDELRWKEDKYG